MDAVVEDVTARPRALGVDVVTWLTVYLVVLYAVPSWLVIGPLGSAGSVSMLLGLVSFGLWVLYRVGSPFPGVLAVHPIRIALCVFIVSIGISYALAMSRPINPDEISPADVSLIALMSWSGTLLMAHDGISSRERFQTFLWRVTIAGGLMGAFGLFQFFTKQTWVSGISIPGLTANGEGTTFFRNGLLRPVGMAIHPIEFGALLTILLPITIHAAFYFKSKPLVLRWLPAAVIVVTIVLSSSRSAYLSAAAALLICMIGWPSRQRRVVLALSGIGLTMISIATPRVLRLITGLFADAENDPSIASRTDSYGYAWAFFLEHPVFGRGMGTFLPKYRIFDNQYLGMLVSVGVVGTASLLLLAVIAMNELVKVYRAAEELAVKDIAVALIGAIAAGFLSLAFFDAFAFPMTMGTLFLLLGLAGAAARLYGTRRAIMRTSPPRQEPSAARVQTPDVDPGETV